MAPGQFETSPWAVLREEEEEELCGKQMDEEADREMLMIWVKSGGEKMLSPFQAFPLTKF